MKDVVEGNIHPLAEQEVAASLFYGFVIEQAHQFGAAACYYSTPEASYDYLALLTKVLYANEVESLLTSVERNLADVADANFYLSFLPDNTELEVTATQASSVWAYNARTAYELEKGESIVVNLGERSNRGLVVHESNEGLLEIVGDHENAVTGVSLSFTEIPAQGKGIATLQPNFSLLLHY